MPINKGYLQAKTTNIYICKDFLPKDLIFEELKIN